MVPISTRLEQPYQRVATTLATLETRNHATVGIEPNSQVIRMIPTVSMPHLLDTLGYLRVSTSEANLGKTALARSRMVCVTHYKCTHFLHVISTLAKGAHITMLLLDFFSSYLQCPAYVLTQYGLSPSRIEVI